MTLWPMANPQPVVLALRRPRYIRVPAVLGEPRRQRRRHVLVPRPRFVRHRASEQVGRAVAPDGRVVCGAAEQLIG
jgi:hypothetical protein